MRTTENVSTEAALFKLHRESGAFPVVATFTVDGEPVSKSRARFTKKGSKTFAYTPEKTRAAEELVAWKFRSATKGWKPDGEYHYGVMALFFNGTRQRRDVDNMIKLILDGLNGVCWEDDNQVAEVSARKMQADKETARTEVMVYRLAPTFLDRLMATCEHCGRRYETYESWVGKRKFCSQKCGYEYRTTRKTAVCIQCGNEYIAHGAEEAKTRKYCSKECRAEHTNVEVECSICGTKFNRYRSWVKERNYCSKECTRENDRIVHRERKSKYFPGTCIICGAGTTRKEYKRCNPCKLAGKTVEEHGVPF